MDVASPATVKRAEPRVEEGGVKETFVQSAVIDRLLSNLTIAPVRDTRIIEVKYESPDPELAARIVNTLTSTYIKQNLEVKVQGLEGSHWCGWTQQLAEQRRKVEISELALQNYREQENSLSLEAGQNIVVQRLNALNSAVTQAKTDLIAVEGPLPPARGRSEGSRGARHASRRSGPTASCRRSEPGWRTFSASGLQLARSLGRQASGDGSARHGDRRRPSASWTTEVAKTVESVRQEYLAAVAREKELTAALDTQKASALALNRRASSTASCSGRWKATARSIRAFFSARTRRQSSSDAEGAATSRSWTPRKSHARRSRPNIRAEPSRSVFF